MNLISKRLGLRSLSQNPNFIEYSLALQFCFLINIGVLIFLSDTEKVKENQAEFTIHNNVDIAFVFIHLAPTNQ
ncbi:hypothetical protein NC652_019189 [Populus alba x Populus x berolinensis]|uniref:Uncharacterized protein n=1 Tax=Populus alba x Populus x berolinensis TaxID=444605 RepID=A0AAD6QHU4_9ROSI|nr:hypothetical protein NC652_018274 [Populus alba x Populus x berolinensis]KAJ6916695.1 hypothetical protein NC652_019189 [Populus alba x Populus x berolinensis]KAJ6990644.1 hypothetical protein NC653_019033 [Populus alba x Populus x berolinensis]KAJ6990657.1 hypothetical protein NC653_019042 [Populus alba x Populus x berolinensis]